jgi:hypothetical protein
MFYFQSSTSYTYPIDCPSGKDIANTFVEINSDDPVIAVGILLNHLKIKVQGE